MEEPFDRLPFFSVENRELAWVLRLNSLDGTNRLTRACVLSLNGAFDDLAGRLGR